MIYLLDHDILVGDAAVDALGAAEDKREELKEAKARKMANRNQGNRAGREMQGRGRPADVMSKQEARALLLLGREMLLVMKMIMASLMVLCVVTVVFVLKK